MSKTEWSEIKMTYYMVAGLPYSAELYHHGIKGQKWGIRRFENSDGTLTDAGKKRYGSSRKESRVEKKSKEPSYVRHCLRQGGRLALSTIEVLGAVSSYHVMKDPTASTGEKVLNGVLLGLNAITASTLIGDLNKTAWKKE